MCGNLILCAFPFIFIIKKSGGEYLKKEYFFVVYHTKYGWRCAGKGSLTQGVWDDCKKSRKVVRDRLRWRTLLISISKTSMTSLSSLTINTVQHILIWEIVRKALTSLSLLCSVSWNSGSKSFCKLTSSSAKWAAGMHACPKVKQEINQVSSRL